jgi:phenylacetate-CoA ligase
MVPVHHHYLELVRKTQWLAPDELLTYQARLIAGMARHAYAHVPFYRQRLKPLFRGEDLDLRAWHDIPVLSRSDVLSNLDAMRALAVPLGAARDSEGRTSGTSGASLAFVQSEIAGVASRCLIERMFESHGVDKTARLARIHLAPDDEPADFPDGAEGQGWNLTDPAAPYSRLSIRSSIAEQAEWLLRRAPGYLATYQSTASALARYFEANGRRFPLRAVLTGGETVDPLTRAEVRRAFGCEIIDRYATNEIGHIASQCPTEDGYHVCSESILLELLDSNGRDVEPGEPGRVVLTSLYNFAMPFIRYDIGDFAVAAAAACSCGSTLPRLAAVLGRQRNIFTFPDGSQYSPWRWKAIFRRHISAPQIQLVQTAPDRIELRYVPRDGADTPDAAAIAETGRREIHPGVTVMPIAVAAIERHSSGKIEDCVSLVTRNLEQGKA